MLSSPDPNATVSPGVVARPPGRARSRPWIAIGLLVVGFVVLGAVFLLSSTSLPEDYPAVAVPGQRSMELTAGRAYTLYFEYPGAKRSERWPPDMHVTGPTGDEEPLLPLRSESTYETATGGQQGRAFARIRPTVTGIYRVEAGPATDAAPGEELHVTIGVEESDTFVLVWFAALLFGVGLVVAGVVVLIVRAVRRRRGKSLAPGVSPPDARSSAPPGPAPMAWAPPDPTARAEE